MYTALQRLHIYTFINNIKHNHGIWHYLFDKDYIKKDNEVKVIFKFILSSNEYKFEEIVKNRLSFEDLLEKEGIRASFDWSVDVAYHADREDGDGKKQKYCIFVLRPYDGIL